MRKARMPKFDMKYFALQGGEDLITPSLSVDPGRAILTQNYELDMMGRYRLIDGYEVFDGHPKPSAASYHILDFDAGSAEISVGDSVAGAAATGEALYVIIDSGTWAGGDAAGYLVLFNVSGDYANDENLTVGGLVKAVANGTAVENGASNDTLDSTYLLAAIEARRADIAAVPGSGNVLGVWQYGGTVYAFRNNAGGTAAALYKSSAAGWVLCDLGRTVAFTSGGAYQIQENDVITGATSTNTATVKRVILTSGTWAGGDAAGTLVLYSQVGDLQAENLNVGANLNVATIAANSTATTLPAGGRYEFITHNFGGHSGTRRMYGVNGVGKGFEWDGSVFVPITTGMTTDTPEHIIAHKNHLFFLFSGGSVQHSGLGTPYIWSALTGASEIGVGDAGTGFLSQPNVLTIFSRNSTNLLYGTGSADWDLRPHSDESGAIEWTMQRIGSGIYLDDRGLTSLSATDQYGDFAASTLSKFIEPYLKTQLNNVQGSVRVKDKNQYRLFFTDLSAITLTLDGNKVIGFTRQNYGTLPVCICATENSTGKEEIFFGSTDGFVYQMDSGTSFNGSAIEALIKFHFNHLKSPQVKKRIRKIVLELDAPISTYLSSSIEFDYGATGTDAETFEPEQPGGVWDVSAWDAFVWDGRSVASAPLDIDGTGLNFSLTIYHSGVWELQSEEDTTFGDSGIILPYTFSTARTGITGAQPHTLQGYTVQFDYRGIQR